MFPLNSSNCWKLLKPFHYIETFLESELECLKRERIGQSAAKFFQKDNNMFKKYKDTDYLIYDDGRCYSLKTNRFLTPKMSVKYPTYNLTIDGKKKQKKVHRLVAETFLPQPEGKEIVNHIDGDTYNFNLSNLEWVDEKENSRHAVNTGLRPAANMTINRFVGNLDGEEWRPVQDFPLYVISSLGRVMNISTKRLLKHYKNNSGGYYTVNLWKNDKGHNKTVHRLVYEAFSGEKVEKGFVINHIDGDKENNNFKNLEKITYQENNLHAAYAIKTNKSTKEVLQLDEDLNILKAFNSIAQAQRELNISNISRAIKNEGKAGGFYWKFRFND